MLVGLDAEHLCRLGLIGKTVPPKGLLIRFQRIVRPTLPAVSVAPMTATVFGAKKDIQWLRAFFNGFTGWFAD